MINPNRSIAAACLALFWSAVPVSAQVANQGGGVPPGGAAPVGGTTPAGDAPQQVPPAAVPQPTSFHREGSVRAASAPLVPQVAPAQQANPLLQPSGGIANQQPAPVQPAGAAGQPTAPAPLIGGVVGAPFVHPPDPVLGADLHNNIKVDAQNFREKSAAAKQDFAQRQAAEANAFAGTVADKGFWERRRLTAQFRDAQAAAAVKFNAEQEKKRRLYEWRYP